MFEKKPMALTLSTATIKLIENGYTVETYLKAVDPKQYSYENKTNFFSSFGECNKFLKRFSEALEDHNIEVRKVELTAAAEAKSVG